MIITTQNKGVLKYHNKIFADKLLFGDMFSFVQYSNYKGSSSSFGFVKQNGETVLIDLRLDEEEILNQTKSKFRNEIRRGSREEMQFVRVSNVNEFVKYFNIFASHIGLNEIDAEKLLMYGDSLIMTKVVYQDEVLAMHSYLVDEDIVVLLQSASNQTPVVDRKFVGIGNRFLHYKDMIFFKKRGCDIYDFGGISTSDPKKAAITKFKMGFGGTVQRVTNYKSVLFWLIGLIKK